MIIHVYGNKLPPKIISADDEVERCYDYRVSELPENVMFAVTNYYSQTLRICQIADPHLGPFMSAEKLHSIVQSLVDLNPDMIILTGDFFSGALKSDGLLSFALSPLKEMSVGKCFACLGNHDMEDDTVLQRTINELKQSNVRLLRNESIIVDIFKNDKERSRQYVQMLGLDYISHSKSELRKRTLNGVMREADCELKAMDDDYKDMPRVFLIHDPGCFKELKGDEKVVVFSGHTHGGHCGMLFNKNPKKYHFSFLPFWVPLPDNGLWMKGNNKLYVHRGQGSRALFGNYLLRCGMPTEMSYVKVEW